MAFLATKDVADRRLSICKACPSFQKLTHTCAECRCFMPAKTRLPNATCPLGKWTQASADGLVEEKDLHVRYKVLAVNPDQHSLTVRYFTDILTEDLLAVDRDEHGAVRRCRFDYNLTVWSHEATIEELERQIKLIAPIQQLRLAENLLLGKRSQALTHLVVGEVREVAAATAPPPKAAKELTDAEIEKLLDGLQ